MPDPSRATDAQIGFCQIVGGDPGGDFLFMSGCERPVRFEKFRYPSVKGDIAQAAAGRFDRFLRCRKWAAREARNIGYSRYGTPCSLA